MKPPTEADAKWRAEAARKMMPAERVPFTAEQRAALIAAVMSGKSVGEAVRAVQAPKGTEAE